VASEQSHLNPVEEGLGAACRSMQEASTAQLKQRLVAVRADYEQTIVNKAIDEWSKRLGAFVKTKGQHFKHSLFTTSRTVRTYDMF